MKFFMGIEGVATRHSVAVISDPIGNICSAVRLNLPLSLHTTPGRDLRGDLRRLLDAVLKPVDIRINQLQDSILCIGLSGMTFDYNQKIDVPNLFKEMGIGFENLICTPDTHIIFASHAKSRQGSTLTCNMGSMAYVATPLSDYRVGGWGPILGDEGSGYWMGYSALQAIGKEVDRNDSPSILWNEILKFLNDTEKVVPAWERHSLIWLERCEFFRQHDTDLRTGIFSFVHDLSLNSISDLRLLASSLVIPLMKAWQKQDKTATEIVEKAAHSLIYQLDQACKQAHVTIDHGPLVLYGGVFKHYPEFRNLVHQFIETKHNCRIQVISINTPGTMRPACGALLLALGGSNTGKLRLPNVDVIQRVFAEQASFHGALIND